MLLTRRKVIAAKIESTPGDAEALSASEAAFNVFDAKIKPNIPFNERPGQGGFSSLRGVPGARSGQVTFAIEIHGSGNAGTPVPAWASTFLPACGFVDSADIFSPESKHPTAAGANTKTLTIGLYQDGKFKSIKGAMGTATITLTAGQVARMEFTFNGLWVAPSDVGILAPNYPDVTPLRFASSGLAVGAFTPLVEQVTLDLGNSVALREDSRTAEGYSTAAIGERRVTGSMNPEATLVAEDDQHAAWLAVTEAALAIELGGSSGNGNRVNIAAPKLQWSDIDEGDRNGVQTDEMAFQCNRSADAGDDELTIEFS